MRGPAWVSISCGHEIGLDTDEEMLTYSQVFSLLQTARNGATRYNTKRPNMSLNWDELETPIQAFYRKIDNRGRRLPFMIKNLR